VAVGSAGGAARAADPPHAPTSVKVIVVDTQRVIHESKAGKAIEAQLQQRFAAYQKDFAKQEAELKSNRQALQKQQSILAQDAFTAKAKEFDMHVGEVGRSEKQAQRALLIAQNEAMAKEIGAIREILEEIAKKRGANLVLDRAAVMFFDVAFDVTDEVLKRLDEKMPTFTVKFPSPGQVSTPAKKPAAKSKD
jgi:Skp family chaperone for outer membrane proteins